MRYPTEVVDAEEGFCFGVAGGADYPGQAKGAGVEGGVGVVDEGLFDFGGCGLCED